MNVTAWASGLEVTGGGTGIVSHAGLGLVRRLAGKTGLTRGLSQALFCGRVLGHDRGRVLADISCAIADGASAVSDFRVLADQAEASGQVASVPTAYRTLEEITRGGTRTEKKLTAAVSAARRYAWTQVVARHGKLPGVLVPGHAWEIAIDHRGEVRERRADDACSNLECGHRACWIEEAHVTELTGLLREGPGGDQLAGWPESMRIFARRERPIPAPGSRFSIMRTGTGASCGSPTCRPPRRAGAARPPTSTPATASMPGSKTAQNWQGHRDRPVSLPRLRL